MSSDLDRLARLTLRRAAQIKSEQQEAEKRRRIDIKLKQAEKALETRRALLIGETIRDAKLTHEEKAVVCRIISRRESKPADWDKISDFTIAVVPSMPDNHQTKPVHSEFVRAGK
jgi:hypothetical protein